MRRIRRTDDAAALAFLDRSPYENVFLSWTIASHKTPSFRQKIHIYAGESRIEGVAMFGGHVVLAAENERAVDAFAETQSAGLERMIVGPRKTIERYWNAVASRHEAPRLVRKSQPLLAIDRHSLRGNTNGVTVRTARPAEWESVALNSAAMIREELGYDPRAGSGEFDANVRATVERGAWWVGAIEGRLCFYCNEGPYSPRTLQLQGIWTPPDMRRRGLASAALYGICERLLQTQATLSLYVNDFNAPALALYARLGFTQVGEFTTLLF